MLKIRYYSLSLYFITSCFFVGYGQNETEKGLNAITENVVKGQLEFLASDWTEGREVGTKGAYLAADYIASVFRMYGIKPFGDVEQKVSTRSQRLEGIRPQMDTTYFQNFSLMEYSPGEIQSLSVISENVNGKITADFNFKSDFVISSGSVGRSGNAPLVFAGYGYKDEKQGYDDLKDIDVKGKIAVVLPGFPGSIDSSGEAYRRVAPGGRYVQSNLERNKIERLKAAGAVAIIQIDTESTNTLSWAQNKIYPVKGAYYESDDIHSSYYDTRMTLPGEAIFSDIPVVVVSARVGGEIFAGTGIRLETFEASVAENMVPASQDLPGKAATFKTTVDSRIVKARNVLGVIEGEKK